MEITLNEDEIPNAKSLIRFQTSLLTGKFNGRNIVDAANADPELAVQILQLNECRQMYAKFYRARRRGLPDAQMHYIQNIFCISFAACPRETQALLGQYASREGETDSARSERIRRSRVKLERCNQGFVKRFMKAINVPNRSLH